MVKKDCAAWRRKYVDKSAKTPRNVFTLKVCSHLQQLQREAAKTHKEKQDTLIALLVAASHNHMIKQVIKSLLCHNLTV